MKGLPSIPTLDSLALAYARLQSGHPITSEQLALWSQWTRLDPRLAEIFVAYLAKHWQTIDLFSLRNSLLLQPWPESFGVLSENVLACRLIAKSETKLFRSWMETLLSGIEPAPNEMYFFGTRRIGSPAQLQDVVESTKPYRRWGYFGRELLVNKANPKGLSSIGTTLLPAPARARLRKELARRLPRFTIHDYQAALDFQVSRRQAEIDLANDPEIRATGNTRARFYRAFRRGK